jgi:glycosyltransferase involved in cell wall biosynthesis
MGKLLTIVIPAYNAEATIGNALSSLNYKYSKYFNVLILDDGSKKPLKPFIKKWLNDYQDVITCIRKKNTN